MVSECHLFFLYFFVICACQAVMHNREFMFCLAPIQVREMGAWCGFTAWRSQYFRRLAGPAFSPLGGPSIYAAWRGPILTPLGQLYPPFRPSGTFPRKRGKEKIPAWRAQCFRCLARVQYLRRLARPVFIPLGEASVYPAWRGQCLSRLVRPSVFAA